MPIERVTRRPSEKDLRSIMRFAQRELGKNGRTSVRDTEEAPKVPPGDILEIMKHAQRHLSDFGRTDVRIPEDYSSSYHY